MIGRREFGLAGISALSVAAMGAGAFAAQKKEEGNSKGDGGHHHGHKGHMDECAKACNACQRECDACATHCAHLLADGKKAHLASLMSCRDCADFCATAAQIVSRGGPFADLICEACAKACERCAKECEKFPDDEHMKKCAKECRQCEKACREMLQHAGHDKPA